MTAVQEHPEWETTAYDGSFVDDAGSYDEGLHKLESEARMKDSRFR